MVEALGHCITHFILLLSNFVLLYFVLGYLDSFSIKNAALKSFRRSIQLSIIFPKDATGGIVQKKLNKFFNAVNIIKVVSC